MIKEVIKADGSVEKFDLDKLSRWAKYAAKVGGDWSDLAVETFSKLPERCESERIHRTMIDVCYSKNDLTYSRVAARLELAKLRKNIERKLGLKVGLCTFKEIRDKLLEVGVWDKETIPEYTEKQETLYSELNKVKLESYQIAQWTDKYLLSYEGVVIETPAIAAMGIGLGVFGDTNEAYNLASDIVYSRVNLPTPVLNGIRNGDFDGISCTVISGGDTVDSIEVVQHLSTKMTAKKAGIGAEFTTRSVNSSVKGGRIKHLGKHSIYSHIDTAVKQFTQTTRGGSATISFNVIDPEVENIALWKSQRIDIEQRLDKLDYSFCFNDAFLEAVVKKQDWYLFDYQDAPKVWDAFYKTSVVNYFSIVQQHIDGGVPHKKVKALDLLKHLLIVRQETGRMYCFNVSRANTHTPFIDVIKLSNLCQEICLPTKPYKDMLDLYTDNLGKDGGETAFCAIAAIVPVNIRNDEEYKRVAKTLVKTVNTIIEKCPKMTINHERTMLERMSLGIGITGLADWLYKEGLDYDGSEESLIAVNNLAEKHSFCLYSASVDIAEETGKSVKGITDWLPVDTRVNKHPLTQDWESLRGKPRANSVLVAHMPTESSSLATGVYNGVYPPRKRVINKKSNRGVVQFISKWYDASKPLLVWDMSNITLSKYYSIIQDWTDQAISADEYFDPRKHEGGKRKLSDLIKEFIAHFRLGNKTKYYVNTYDNDEVSVFDIENEEDCEGCRL